MQRIYLDYQASTPILNEVLEEMEPFFSEAFGNPHSSEHYKGWESQKAIEVARKKIARALNADHDEIIFTSGATESNNLAIKGLLPHMKLKGKNKILLSSIEHKCTLMSAQWAKDFGFEVIHLPPNKEGIITPKQLQSHIDKSVGLVSVMLVNNEIGTIQPVSELAAITHQYGALLHTDAAQAPSFMEVNARNLGADLISLSGHKVYGPKGIGCLYINRDIREHIKPLIDGGGQEGGIRSGTLPTPLCVGFGCAIQLAYENAKQNRAFLECLSRLFLSELEAAIPSIKVNGSTKFRHPGNLNICLPDIDARSFLQALQPTIAAATGSACSSGIEEPSYVLRAIGLTHEEASASIRFSFGISMKEQEVITAVKIIAEKYEDMLYFAS